jgi:lipid-binding SYLF domain-containing protein
MSALIWLALTGIVAGVARQLPPDETRRLTEAAAVAADARAGAAAAEWDRALCVVIFPGTLQPGAEARVSGVMSCRAGDGWSAPLYATLTNAGAVSQARSDIVLLVVNESGLERLLRGPLAVETDVRDVLSFARTADGFAAADLGGARLAPDDRANRAAYGQATSPRRILAMRELSAPTAAAPFLRALGGGHATGATATPGAQPGTARDTQPATAARTDDIRARLLDLQQAIDRLLADTTPAAIGTTGAAGDPGRAGTVTVDRARLIQLRQQVEAAIAALNR